MSQDDYFDQHAELLRVNNAMGRSDVLLKLFEFLLAGSRIGAPPKEIEIGIAVFGKTADFDMAQDAAVRVYVHRLRKKLDEFYAGAGKDQPQRLSIPKGEYRIVVEPLAAAVAEPDTPAPRRQRPPRAWLIAGIAVLLLNTLAWAAYWRLHTADDGFAAVRQRAPWAPLLQENRPLVLAIGDYYIFGEIDRAKGIDRLVREYAINSREALNEHVMQHPQLRDTYKDLQLSYLPVSIPFVLRELLPILAPTKKDRARLRIVMASRITPDMLKQANIVYVGYLSGLGVLREPVLAGSRFVIGETFDELIDTRSKHHYHSQESGPNQSDGRSVDYGYFSTFQGPEGNRIVILAGMRDVGAMQTAEALTTPETLSALLQKSNGAQSFEALYEVDGIERLNLSGQLLVTSPLQTEKIWRGRQ